MIKKIFAFGDSFVQGHGVDSNDTWVAKLGRMFGLEVANLGVSGGSNKLSLVKLFDHWPSIDDDSLVIFAWTSPVRTAFYHTPTDNWENVQLGHYYEDVGIRSRVEHYYAHHYNDTEGYTEFYQQQIMLDGLLKNKGIKYCFVNSFLDNPKGTVLPLSKRDFYERMIDRSKYILGASSIFNTVCVNNKMVCKDGFHPSEEGHLWLANHTYSWLAHNNFDLPEIKQYNNI